MAEKGWLKMDIKDRVVVVTGGGAGIGAALAGTTLVMCGRRA